MLSRNITHKPPGPLTTYSDADYANSKGRKSYTGIFHMYNHATNIVQTERGSAFHVRG